MSKQFILDSSELSQWHTLVHEAEQDYGCHLDEAMQSYLVFTLMRFAKNQQLNAKALALDYLNSHHLPNSIRSEQLRDIGDQCLLVSGLYPQSAEKRQVGVSYYVDLGRSAYQHIVKRATEQPVVTGAATRYDRGFACALFIVAECNSPFVEARRVKGRDWISHGLPGFVDSRNGDFAPAVDRRNRRARQAFGLLGCSRVSDAGEVCDARVARDE